MRILLLLFAHVAVAAAVLGQDAVLSALGHRHFLSPTAILSLGTSAFRMGLWYTFFVLPLVLPFYFWDKARQERLVAQSACAWTIVRPANVARANVAAFMLDPLVSDVWLRRAPGVGL